MANIYITENLFNKKNNIEPWRYIGSDQHDNPNYFGSNTNLKKDIENLGTEWFTKTILESFETIDNKDLRKLEADKYLKPLNVKKDSSYYNQSDLYAPGGGIKGMKHSKKFPRSEKWTNSKKGWKPNEETRKIWVEQRTGKKAKESTKQLMSQQHLGENNPNSLLWTIITPKGVEYQIKGLKRWCIENNISYMEVYNQRNGWVSIKHGVGKGGRGKKNG